MIAPKWFEYIEYLSGWGIETHGVFRSQSRPNAIIALMSYEVDSEPLALSDGASMEFLIGLAGVDIKQIIRSDDLLLQPLPSSRLQ
jgi:hypothetical protein